MVDFKALRNKVGLTQAALAEIVGVAENTIQNWESGKTVPKGEKMTQYLNALGIVNPTEIQRIIAEISVLPYAEESEEIDNIPYFLFTEESDVVDKIKGCYATAEELDMLGYVEYVRWDGKYSRLERRGEAKFPLEFAFFERYGGYNATRKKISDARSRLGKLYTDAVEFAEKNPGCDYRLSSFDKSTIIGKIALFLDNKNYQNDIRDLYNSLKTVEAVGTPIFSQANMNIRIEKGKEIDDLLKKSFYSRGEVELGKLTGYVEFIMDETQERPSISMLNLTDRGKRLISWFDENK